MVAFHVVFGGRGRRLLQTFKPGLGGVFWSKIGLIGSIPIPVSVESSAKLTGLVLFILKL